jgi:hypothetical protein
MYICFCFFPSCHRFLPGCQERHPSFLEDRKIASWRGDEHLQHTPSSVAASDVHLFLFLSFLSQVFTGMPGEASQFPGRPERLPLGEVMSIAAHTIVGVVQRRERSGSEDDMRGSYLLLLAVERMLEPPRLPLY